MGVFRRGITVLKTVVFSLERNRINRRRTNLRKFYVRGGVSVLCSFIKYDCVYTEELTKQRESSLVHQFLPITSFFSNDFSILFSKIFPPYGCLIVLTESERLNFLITKNFTLHPSKENIFYLFLVSISPSESQSGW